MEVFQCTMTRRDSIFSAFRMEPADSGSGLCDIYRVLIIVAKSRQKREVLARQK